VEYPIPTGGLSLPVSAPTRLGLTLIFIVPSYKEGWSCSLNVRLQTFNIAF